MQRKTLTFLGAVALAFIARRYCGLWGRGT